MTNQLSLFGKLEALPVPVTQPESEFLGDLLIEYQKVLGNILEAESHSQRLVLSLNGKPGKEYDLNNVFQKLRSSLFEDCVHAVAHHYSSHHGLKLDAYKYIGDGQPFTREHVTAWIDKTTGGNSLNGAALRQLQDKFTFRRILPVVTKTSVTMKNRVYYAYPYNGVCFNYGSSYGRDLEELVHYLNTNKVTHTPREIFDHQIHFDRYLIDGSVVISLELFKNGNVKLNFASEQGVTKFVTTFVNN